MDQDALTIGKLDLKRYSGNERFPISLATYEIDFDSIFQRFNLHLNVKLGHLEGVEKTDQRADITPEWDLHFPLSEIEVHHLDEGLSLEIPYGYIDAVDDYYALFHYFERIPSFKNKMTLVGIDEDKWCIAITGMTDDVEFYDGSKPLASIGVKAWFTPTDKERLTAVLSKFKAHTK